MEAEDKAVNAEGVLHEVIYVYRCPCCGRDLDAHSTHLQIRHWFALCRCGETIKIAVPLLPEHKQKAPAIADEGSQASDDVHPGQSGGR